MHHILSKYYTLYNKTHFIHVGFILLNTILLAQNHSFFMRSYIFLFAHITSNLLQTTLWLDDTCNPAATLTVSAAPCICMLQAFHATYFLGRSLPQRTQPSQTCLLSLWMWPCMIYWSLSPLIEHFKRPIESCRSFQYRRPPVCVFFFSIVLGQGQIIGFSNPYTVCAAREVWGN